MSGSRETPYARRASSVPVFVVTTPAALSRFGGPDTAIVRLPRPPHEHAPGTECLACDAQGNVRVLLFDLQEKLRLGLVKPFLRVVVDASEGADAMQVADALVPGRLPAFGLRDHAVAKNFHLAEIV